MQVPGEYVLLRAYLLYADRPPHVPTYQSLVRAAHDHRLLGATVLKAILGCGRRGIVPGSSWSLAEQVPVVVELLDKGETIKHFIRGPLEQIMFGGMITLERAVLLRTPPKNSSDASPSPPVPAPQPPLQLAPPIAPLSTLPQLQVQSGSRMTSSENGIMLRVFIGESDRCQGKPTYEAIVQKVRELGLAGATVLRGSEGFGASSVVHRAGLLAMSIDLPIVVEIIDVEEKINRLLPHLELMVQGGMVTMEYVSILLYRHGPAAAEDGMPEHPDAMV